jgi:hypothetical protein
MWKAGLPLVLFVFACSSSGSTPTPGTTKDPKLVRFCQQINSELATAADTLGAKDVPAKTKSEAAQAFVHGPLHGNGSALALCASAPVDEIVAEALTCYIAVKDADLPDFECLARDARALEQATRSTSK